MEQQPVPHRDVLREPGDELSEDNLEDLEAINSNQTVTESKKRRFHPLRAVRKIFRRRTSKGSLKDEEAIMKSRSTSELHGATDRGSNSSIGDDRQSLDLSQPLYSSGLSLSHDSIFSPETPSSGQSIQGHAESNPSIQKLALKSLKDELTAKLRQRQDSDYEDAGFPRSPQYTTSTTDFPIQESKRNQGKSRYSDGSHLSTGSSDADADSGQSSLHSSRICVTEKRPENGDPDLDIGATTLLSNAAARHKISIRPKRTRSAMGHRMLQQTDGYPSTQLSPSMVLPATPEDDDEESADSLEVTESVFTFSPYHGTTDSERPGNVAVPQEPFDIIQSVMQSRAFKTEEVNAYQETRTTYISENVYDEATKQPIKAKHEESKTVNIQDKRIITKPEESKVIEDKETKLIEMFTEHKVVEKHREPRKPEEPRFAKDTEELKVTEISREHKLTRGTAEQRLVKDVEEVKVVEKIMETKVTKRSEEPRVIKDAEEVKVIEKPREKATRRSEETRVDKDADEVHIIEKTRETKVTRRTEEPRAIKEQKQEKYFEDEQFGYGSDDNSDPVTSTCFRIGRHRSRKPDSELSHHEKERGEGAFSKIFGSRRSSRKKKHDEKPIAVHVGKEEHSMIVSTPEPSNQNSTDASPGGTVLVVQSWGERNPIGTTNHNESKYKRAISMDDRANNRRDKELAKAAEKKVLAVTRSVSASGEGGIVARLSRNYEHSQEDVSSEVVNEKALKKSSSQGKLSQEKTIPKEEEVKIVEASSTAKKPPSYSAITRDRGVLQDKVEEESQKVVIPRASLSPWRARRQIRQRVKSPTRPIQGPIEDKGSSSNEVHLPDVLINESDERRRKVSDAKRRPIQQQLSNEDIAELEMFPRSRPNSDSKDLGRNDKDDKVKAVVDSDGMKSLEIITISPPPVIRSTKRALASEPREDTKVQETPIQVRTTPKGSPVNKSPPVKDNLNPLSWKETFLEKTEIVVQYTNPNIIDRNTDVHVPLTTTNKNDVDSHVRENNNNIVLVESGQVNVPSPRAAAKLRPRPLSQNIIPNADKNDQSELMRVFNRRSLKVKDNENPNVECVVPEKQAPVEEKTAPVVAILDCPPVVIELSSVVTTTTTEPAVVTVETTQATDEPQWRKLALLRREQRQKEYKEKSIQDTSQLIIHDAAKSVSRSSKVLDMVNSFQKFQVNMTN